MVSTELLITATITGPILARLLSPSSAKGLRARPFTSTPPDDGIIDPVAVEIAARGIRPVALTAAERQQAAARILAQGGTPTHVSTRLHVSGTTALVLAARCPRLQAAAP